MFFANVLSECPNELSPPPPMNAPLTLRIWCASLTLRTTKKKCPFRLSSLIVLFKCPPFPPYPSDCKSECQNFKCPSKCPPLTLTSLRFVRVLAPHFVRRKTLILEKGVQFVLDIVAYQQVGVPLVFVFQSFKVLVYLGRNFHFVFHSWYVFHQLATTPSAYQLNFSDELNYLFGVSIRSI